MASNGRSQLQSLGNGEYRVTGVRVSSKTGRYLTGSAATTATTKGSSGRTSSKSAESK